MAYLIYSVEDDSSIARLIKVTLSKQGHEVEVYPTGSSFLNAFKQKKPDLVLVDLMLPDMSGSKIIKTIRADSSNDDIDIIVISANHMTMDKVDNLDLGADDYIEKPFDILELMSRINAHLRRRRPPEVIVCHSVSLDLEKHVCTKNDETVLLTTREFDVLSLLFGHKGNTVSREEILEKIWNIKDANLETRTIDMHIRSLRKKLGDNDLIETVYGCGYRVNK